MKKLFTLLVIVVVALNSSAQKQKYHAHKFNNGITFCQSPELRSVVSEAHVQYDENHEEFDHIQRMLPIEPGKGRSLVSVQERQFFNNEAAVIIQNFEGVHNVNNSPNPDTEGDVGPDHYFQMVKSSFAVWDKEGNLLYGPADNKTLWNSLLGPWHNMGWTDPIVIYDPISDRWLVSAMVYDLYNEYYEMVAVSSTPDPLGTWNCYALHFNEMPDYPKIGVWPDGYYLTFNHYELQPGISTFSGAGLLVFNREDLINGVSDPNILYFRLEAPNEDILEDPSSFLPSDLDGQLPPQGMPNYLTTIRDDAWGYASDHIWMWECSVDWEDTLNSTFSASAVIPTAPFDARWDMGGSGWIEQPGTTTKLHGHGHFSMYRLQYRNFNDYHSLVFNHTVNVGNDKAGIRWYELRNQGLNWEIEQSGTYSPDGSSRWMGSIAMDKDGNIGLGYSVSGNTVYPSIRATGRYYYDIAGLMTLPETEIVNGAGNQSYNVRWGDYSMMSVDPKDELTFWYTQQYLPLTGWNAWQTKIASFQIHKNLSAVPDSLVFNTIEECEEGKTLRLENNSCYAVTINEIQHEGSFGQANWFVDPWTINLPLVLQAGESLELTIKIEILSDQLGYVVDSIETVTDYTIHEFPILINGDLLTGIAKPEAPYYPRLRIHPNPFKESVNLKLTLEKKGIVELYLVDITSSRKIFIQEATELKSGSYDYNCGHTLPPGIYFINLRYNNVLKTERVVKI